MVLELVAADYAIIAIMLCVSAAVGLYFRFSGGRQQTTDEFLMAGKNMPLLPVVFSLMATFMSSNSLLGVPADVYMYGSQFVWWAVGVPIGAVIASYLYLPVFFNMKVTTAYEYLERRFGKTTRAIASLMFIIQTILYMAVVLYGPALALNAVTRISLWGSVTILGIVCTFYCSLGGLKAVLWTDVFQAILMFVTIVAVVIKGANDLGGIGPSLEIAINGGRMDLLNINPSLEERYTVWSCTFGGLIFALSTLGANQVQIQRMLTVRSLKRAQWSLLLSVPMMMVYMIFCCLDGIIIYALHHDCDPILRQKNTTLTSPDQLLPYTILTLFEHLPGLSGLCIAGIFSASLSTVSSALNSLTAVTLEDFVLPYCSCKQLTKSRGAFIAKIIAVGYGLLGLCLTVVVANLRGVFEAASIVLMMVAGPLLGVFSLGLFSITANEEGTLIGFFVGFVLSAWMGFGSYVAKVKVPSLQRTITGCPESFNSTIDAAYFNITEIPLDTTETYWNATRMYEDSIYTAKNKDVSAFYKVSFFWFPLFSSVTVIVVGYISSLITGYFRGRKDVHPALVSPVFRKWLFHPSDDTMAAYPCKVFKVHAHKDDTMCSSGFYKELTGQKMYYPVSQGEKQ